jgi:hypothetical protein
MVVKWFIGKTLTTLVNVVGRGAQFFLEGLMQEMLATTLKAWLLQRIPELAVRRGASREMGRAAVTKEDVLRYLENLERIVSGEFHPDLVINMDESRLCQRPLKDSQRNCVFIRTEETRPKFLHVPNGNHISVVAAVALSGRRLLPLFLWTQSPLPEETRASYFIHEFR